jgi:hypothetical protein
VRTAGGRWVGSSPFPPERPFIEVNSTPTVDRLPRGEIHLAASAT